MLRCFLSILVLFNLVLINTPMHAAEEAQIKLASNTKILLSEKESSWLRAHPVIRIVNDKNYPPYDFYKNHIPQGFSVDYLEMLSKIAGFIIQWESRDHWDSAVNDFKGKKVDAMHAFGITDERKEYALFTTPYFHSMTTLFISKDNRSFQLLEEFSRAKIAIPKGYSDIVNIRNTYPDVRIIETNGPGEALRMVALGKADATPLNLGLGNYLIKKLGFSNLNTTGYALFGQKKIEDDFFIGVRNDWPELVQILNKAINAVDMKTLQKLKQKWLITGEEKQSAFSPVTSLSISYKRMAVYGIIIFMFISLLAFILLRILKRENIAVNFGSPWFRGFVLSGLSLFVVIVAFLGWYNLEHNKKQHLQDVDENLRVILSVSQDRFEFWLEERLSYMTRLGRDSDLVALTRRLMQVDPTKESLLKSTALKEIRAFFKNSKDIFPNIGFFVINPDHVSIGSMRDTNLGSRNLISEQHLTLLQRAFQGEVGFVPPITSDVHLFPSSNYDDPGNYSKPNNEKKQPTMFFISPIQDNAGHILAVMTLRVDPWNDFDRAMQSFGKRGRIRSYAFDHNGCMLSASNFEDQLRDIGLLAEGESSALNIEIRDPGGNLFEGHQLDLEPSEHLFTHMASHAITLKQQLEQAGIRDGRSSIESNIEGYRDYRGVTVFGAWLWNVDLNIGLAVEIDQKDAMNHYSQTRVLIFSILSVTLFLSVSAVLFVLIIGERTSQALRHARDDLEATVVQRTSELIDNQQRLRKILESVLEGIFGVDIHGKIIFMNSAANQLLGYNSNELIGQNLHERIHHSYADGSPYPENICPMSKAYTGGKTQTIADEMLWRKDGTTFSVEYTATPMVQGDTITGAVITFRDISERKRLDNMIFAERERLQGILDISPVGVGIYTNKGIMKFANPRIIELFDIKIGDPVPELYVNMEDKDRVMETLKKQRILQDYELQMYGKNREIRDMIATYMMVNYEDKAGILVWVVDVTDLKKTDRELRIKFDELTRFRILAVGREQKMIELKKEINELLKAAGHPAKYKAHTTIPSID